MTSYLMLLPLVATEYYAVIVIVLGKIQTKCNFADYLRVLCYIVANVYASTVVC